MEEFIIGFDMARAGGLAKMLMFSSNFT